MAFCLGILIAIAYFWWSGVVNFPVPPSTVGVYNVRTGKPIMGVPLIYTNAENEAVRLGTTDQKGQIDVENIPLDVLRTATIATTDYIVVSEPGKAKPGITVDVPIYLDYRE